MRRRRHEDDYYGDCPEHGQVPVEWEDHGIGACEYWGSKGIDIQWAAVCPFCGEVLENVE